VENNATVNFSVDFAILTAIEVERRAVCAEFGLGDKDRVKRNGRVYWRGKLPLGDGKAYEIVVAQPAEMGQVEATALATEVAQLWTPRAALMVGIAASTKPNEVQLGDVVVGRSVYYYEHGKVTAEGTRPQPEMIPADSDLLKHYAGLASWDGAVLVPRPDGTTRGPSVLQGSSRPATR
jgi:nucleoside phosphorylase